MILKLAYYGAIIFAVALGISFAFRLIQSGVNACFNGNPIGLLYILAVYLVLYPLARFIFNRRFSRSSQVVVGLGICNIGYALIGMGSYYGIHPVFSIIIEASVVTVFILVRRGHGTMPLISKLWFEFPDSVVPDTILDDCIVFRSGLRGFQVLQFAEVRGDGTGASLLLSAWKARVNLSFEAYRQGNDLCTLVSVWEVSRDFGEAVRQTKEKMSTLREILEQDGYDTRLISDELEIERCIYSPLLAPDGNNIQKLDKNYPDSLDINELGLNSEAKLVSERVRNGEDNGETSVGYVLLLQPILKVENEFKKAEKELKHKIESLASNKFKKNDPAALITMLSLTREGSPILQPGIERSLTESRLKCQRMIDAQTSGLWDASIFIIGTGKNVTKIIKQVNTEKSRECLYELIRRRKYSEKYNSSELSELLPINCSMKKDQDQLPREEEVPS